MAPHPSPLARSEVPEWPRILFVLGAHYLPESTGGAEQTTHELCCALSQRDWAPAVLARTRRNSRFAWRGRLNALLGRGATATDTGLGYPVYRSRTPLDAIEPVCRDFKPALAVVQLGALTRLARDLLARGVPTIMFLHNLSYDQMGGDFFRHPLLRYATVSEFMASALEARLGHRPAVVPPLIRPEHYATSPARRVATFVNPTPLKGLDVALHLARRRPDVPFEVIESWTLRSRELNALKATLEGLPNVRFVRRTDDMRPVYGRARVLLVPSQWDEPFGRVASEAQVSGIPVIASRAGGLPEAVGPGGILVEPRDSLEAWEQAFASLWDDPAAYETHAAAALAHARRADFQPEVLLGAFEALAREHLQTARQP